MQSIPSTLLDKLKQAMQTIGNNADPKMDIIAQKASKYLSQGNFLRPRTVRTGNSLGPLDICIRREDQNKEPSEIVMAYIEDGQAKVATLPYVNTPDQNFEYKYTIGPATDVACDFDGCWYRITDRTGIYFDTSIEWALVTFGEPYIATVNAGILSVQKGNDPTSAVILAPDSVIKCSMIRGWKNIQKIDDDQGIIVAYVKTDNKAYYTNYAIQPDETIIWEVAREITGSWMSVSNVNLFRTNDYRTGILIEADGNIYLMLTNRNWAGMAIPAEHISGFLTKISNIILTKMIYDQNYFEEHIAGLLNSNFIFALGDAAVIDAAIVSITKSERPQNAYIQIQFNYPVIGSVENKQTAFKVETLSASKSYTVISTQPGATPDILLLNFAETFDTVNDLNVTYNPNIGELKCKIEEGIYKKIPSFVKTVSYMPTEGNTNHRILGQFNAKTIIFTEIVKYTYNQNSASGTVTGKLNNFTSIVITKVGTSDV